jgi:hypothetical protein
MVEQGEVRGHLVAPGREVGSPQLLQPAIVAVAEQGGDDQRRRRRRGAAGQIST